jgi:hypothetical protein
MIGVKIIRACSPNIFTKYQTHSLPNGSPKLTINSKYLCCIENWRNAIMDGNAKIKERDVNW